MTTELSVRISFLPTAEGGRQTPIPEGEYRGVFKVGEECFSIRFPLSWKVSPGQVKTINVQIIVPEDLSFFLPGTEFEVVEDKVIGHGKVLAMFARDLE